MRPRHPTEWTYSAAKSLEGFYVRFDSEPDEASERIRAGTHALTNEPVPGVTDVIPSYTTLYVEYDPAEVTERWLRRLIHAAPSVSASSERAVTLQVHYGGPDLSAVAAELGLRVEDVVRLHAGRPYRVHALGFTPGFPFLGDVDPRIRVPRLALPRPRVEAHSVGIANAQTGVYPTPSPGGWRIVGTALEPVYDPHRSRPFLVEPGDRLTFEAAEGSSPPPVAPLQLLPGEPTHPLFDVVEPGLLDLVVDAGRFLAGRFGLARSGPLDARSAHIANALVGNPPGTPLLEMNVLGPTLEVLSDFVVSFAGWGVAPQLNNAPLDRFETFAVRKGDVLRFPPQKRGVRGYLAVPGGFESRSFLGSVSVDVRGLIGKPLEAGDRLGTDGAHRSVRTGFAFHPYAPLLDKIVLRILPGPQASVEASAACERGVYRVAHADRMGVRLEGGSVVGGDVVSEATALGAIQVSAAGQPMILMHDRGSIGGYTKPSVVHPHDLHRLAQVRAGQWIQFRQMRD